MACRTRIIRAILVIGAIMSATDHFSAANRIRESPNRLQENAL
jgi:hypothetical protein